MRDFMADQLQCNIAVTISNMIGSIVNTVIIKSLFQLGVSLLKKPAKIRCTRYYAPDLRVYRLKRHNLVIGLNFSDRRGGYPDFDAVFVGAARECNLLADVEGRQHGVLA